MEAACHMSHTVSIWKDQYEVESFDVDMNGTLKTHVLFAFLLNSAWNHAKNAGFAYEALSARSLMWVLSKVQIAFQKFPKWGDRVVVETWGKGVEKLFALRDFSISTPNGEKLANATSAWLILQKVSYRPQKLEELMRSFPWVGERSVLETDLKKVPESTNERIVGQFPVAFSDIDMNEHVTAPRYLQWVLDSYSSEVLTARALESVEISFLKEAVLNDKVSVYRESRDVSDLCRIRRTVDDHELCRARIQWRIREP
jgi:acyl-ACP thioesterase